MQILDVDQFICDGVDCKAGRRVDLEFVRDIAAMGGDRVYRKEQRVGNLFVAHPLCSD